MSACSNSADAIAAPSQALTSAALQPTVMHTLKTVKTANGTIDLLENSIRVRGHVGSMRITPELRTLLEQVEAAAQGYDSLAARIKGDERIGRVAKAHIGPVDRAALRARISQLIGSSFGANTDAGSASMMDPCTDIAIAIFDADTNYQRARDDFYSELASVTIDAVADMQIPGASAVGHLAEAANAVISGRTQLDLLAVMYKGSGCWR